MKRIGDRHLSQKAAYNHHQFKTHSGFVPTRRGFLHHAVSKPPRPRLALRSNRIVTWPRCFRYGPRHYRYPFTFQPSLQRTGTGLGLAPVLGLSFKVRPFTRLRVRRQPAAIGALGKRSATDPADFCLIHRGGVASHSRRRTTILHREGVHCKRSLRELTSKARGPVQTWRRGSLCKTARTKGK
jgi:hypothetical protein